MLAATFATWRRREKLHAKCLEEGIDLPSWFLVHVFKFNPGFHGVGSPGMSTTVVPSLYTWHLRFLGVV